MDTTTTPVSTEFVANLVESKLASSWPSIVVRDMGDHVRLDWVDGPHDGQVRSFLGADQMGPEVVLARTINLEDTYRRMLARVYGRFLVMRRFKLTMGAHRVFMLCSASADGMLEIELPAKARFADSEIINVALRLLEEKVPAMRTQHARATQMAEAISDYGVAELFAAAEDFSSC